MYGLEVNRKLKLKFRCKSVENKISSRQQNIFSESGITLLIYILYICILIFCNTLCGLYSYFIHTVLPKPSRSDSNCFYFNMFGSYKRARIILLFVFYRDRIYDECVCFLYSYIILNQIYRYIQDRGKIFEQTPFRET